MHSRNTKTAAIQPSDQQSQLTDNAVLSPENLNVVERLEAGLLHRVLNALGDPPLTVELCNGQHVSTNPDPAVGRVRVADRRTLWKILVDPQFQFGEAYTSGRLQVEGDFLAVLVALNRSMRQRSENTGILNSVLQALRRPARTSLRAARRNIYHHYDIGNEFYKLWLDEQLVYTCAYFPKRSCSLEEAQIAKMDHVCRKVRLQPGQEVIEAGCGWGALSRHMARHYGVKVRAFNISHEQIVYARDCARAEGLGDRVEFVEDDWRNVTGRCDRFVSVGMLEHVGRKNYRRLGDIIHRCLRSDGLGLIHSIGRNRPAPVNSWIERRIFPGGYVPSLGETAEIFEPYDFSILDVENLRLHYAKTLEHWMERFERSVDTVREMFGEEFVRLWRLYLAGSIAAFETGFMQLFQIVFARGLSNDVPWTRDFLYDRQGADDEA